MRPDKMDHDHHAENDTGPQEEIFTDVDFRPTERYENENLDVITRTPSEYAKDSFDDKKSVSENYESVVENEIPSGEKYNLRHNPTPIFLTNTDTE